jgi:hypothetical protein
MKIYVAGDNRWAAMHFACVLLINGHKVTSTWHNEEFERTSAHSDESRACIAELCVQQVREADVLVLISSHGMVPGGKFVEVGVALGSNKRVFVVGHRENMLMYHGSVTQVTDPSDLLARL